MSGANAGDDPRVVRARSSAVKAPRSYATETATGATAMVRIAIGTNVGHGVAQRSRVVVARLSSVTRAMRTSAG